MSPALALVGVSILGTWGLGSIGLIAGGIILLIDPGEGQAASGNILGGLVLIGAGVISGGLMQIVVMPLLGLDPPFPIPAKRIIPSAQLTRWVPTVPLHDLPDGTARELRVKSRRIALVRQGAEVYAAHALCSHARLPFGGFPGSPIKPLPVRDGCMTCPFHGASFELETGRAIRQPFTSEWNNDHPFLGRVQGSLFRLLSRLPAPQRMRVTMMAEDIQTYPVRIEDGEVFVGIPERK